MSYVVVTGGVRSGKSRIAEQLAGEQQRVLYVATGADSDGEMARRIELHQQRRPAHWGLLEYAGEKLTEALQRKMEGEEVYEAVLIDCLSTWVSTQLIHLPEAEWRSTATRQRLHAEAERLAQWLQDVSWQAVVVTNETGLGGVAMTPLGRAFQDLLGEVNQIVAHQAQEMYLVVSGRALRLPSL
jgi:adenosylcobinamide kinase / adenosylcobinamide-phosphate guanylyltransferase